MTQVAALPGKRGAPKGSGVIEYDPEIAEDICVRIATSGKGLATILASDDGFPSYAVVLRWLNSNAEFDEMFTRARELKADFIGDEILEIVDDLDEEANSRRVRADARIKLMEKLNPKRYGNRLDVTSGGEPLPAPPPSIVIDARVQSIMLTAAERKLGAELLDD